MYPNSIGQMLSEDNVGERSIKMTPKFINHINDSANIMFVYLNTKFTPL